MKLYSWSEIPVEQLNPFVTRQVIHTEGSTLARLHLSKGAIIPRHHHVNEQVSTVESGLLRFYLDDQTTIDVPAGHSLQIPPDVPHRVEALQDSVALDLFTPVRQDWLQGNDAYLR
jgi:quercetin dioxygenase-like cupin family protein